MRCATAFVMLVLVHTAGAQDGDAARTQLAAHDAKLLAALEGLARSYDAKKDPEAAHFFAECAIGFGGATDAVRAIRKNWEDEIYCGRARGGGALPDAAEIGRKLAPIAQEYQDLMSRLLKKGKDLPARDRDTLHAAAVRYELARSAHEYIQATQRINQLRRSMKLRAVLWDFDESSRFVSAAWYMGETGDYLSDAKSDESSIYYTSAVGVAKRVANRSPRAESALAHHGDTLRSHVILREDLLNPDARRIALGRWDGGKAIPAMVLYQISRTLYRPDIATPSSRAQKPAGDNKDLWADVEETIHIRERRIIFAHYPFADDRDAPIAFGDGKRTELGWNDPPSKDIKKYGLPITMRWFTKSTPQSAAVEFRREGGPAIEHRVYVNGDPRVELGELATLLILPEKPLQPGTSYSVSIKCAIDGVAFEKTWTFRTRD